MQARLSKQEGLRAGLLQDYLLLVNDGKYAPVMERHAFLNPNLSTVGVPLYRKINLKNALFAKATIIIPIIFKFYIVGIQRHLTMVITSAYDGAILIKNI